MRFVKAGRGGYAMKTPDNATDQGPATNLTPARRQHWETVYQNKAEQELSWHQDDPALSLRLIREVATTGSRVIDVGGGSSALAGRLLVAGITEVTVLDISAAALDRGKSRIGVRHDRIRWIAADVTTIGEVGQFDIWHDRAVFHFLTRPEDRRKYIAVAERTIPLGGHLVIGTFAVDGPDKCSGLEVVRYDAPKLAADFGAGFALKKSLAETHMTPWGKPQQFTYAVFERVKTSGTTTTDTVTKPAVPAIGCTLDPASLAQRKGLLWEVISKATERVAMADGYQFSFDGETMSLSELTEVIALERKCCPFLRFVLTVEPAGGPLRLQLSGANGTKDFLASLFT
jgi:SAM-dependent methyltransferase